MKEQPKPQIIYRYNRAKPHQVETNFALNCIFRLPGKSIPIYLLGRSREYLGWANLERADEAAPITATLMITDSKYRTPELRNKLRHFLSGRVQAERETSSFSVDAIYSTLDQTQEGNA